MIGARHLQDPRGSSFSSTCTSASSNPSWNDASNLASLNHNLLPSQRPTLRSSRHLIIPLVSAARLPISPSSPRAALRDLCLPRQEPRPPADILNRSYLGSCSPSLAKFSRTIVSQHASASTSTTTLPLSHIHPANFLHPTMPYITVNSHGLHHHHHHHCRYIR